MDEKDRFSYSRLPDKTLHDSHRDVPDVRTQAFGQPVVSRPSRSNGSTGLGGLGAVVDSWSRRSNDSAGSVSRVAVREGTSVTAREGSSAPLVRDGSLNNGRKPKRPMSLESENESFREPCCTGCPIILPTSKWIEVWDIIVLAALVQVVFVAPYELAFLELEVNVLFLINRVVDVVFFTDMCMRFFIAIPDPQRRGLWIKQPYEITKNYLKTWFLADLVSCLPVDWYLLFFSSKNQTQDEASGMLQCTRLVKVVRLLRVSHGARIFQRWHKKTGIQNWIVSLGKFFMIVLLCCHWSACFWGAIGARRFENQEDDIGWLAALKQSKIGTDVSYDDHFQIYILSIYWAVMTITGIGYGDITPQTVIEYKVALLCMVCMAGCWAYVIGEICAIMSTLSPHEVTFKRTMDDLNWMMKDWDMSDIERFQLREYLHQAKDSRRLDEHKIIIQQMSPLLQGVVALKLHKEWVSRVSYIKIMERDAIVALVQKLKQKVFVPQERIPPDRSLYVLRRGIAAQSGKVFLTNDIWGEDMILENPFLRKSDDARTLNYCEVLKLAYADFTDCLDHTSASWTMLLEERKYVGLKRGVVLLSRILRDLEYRGILDRSQLTAEQRYDLATMIFAGKITVITLEPDEDEQMAGTYLCEDRSAQTRRRAHHAALKTRTLNHVKDILRQDDPKRQRSSRLHKGLSVEGMKDQLSEKVGLLSDQMNEMATSTQNKLAQLENRLAHVVELSENGIASMSARDVIDQVPRRDPTSSSLFGTYRKGNKRCQ